MSGMYWGLCTLDMMNALDQLGERREEIIDWVSKCQHANGWLVGNI